MLKENLKNSSLAAFMISIGCLVFLSCDNKYIGAALFSIALFLICQFKLLLFTGKVGFLGSNFEKKLLNKVILSLVMNVLICFILGLIFSFTYPDLIEKVKDISTYKISQNPFSIFIRSILCGVIMFSAVYLFQEHRNSLGIFIGIPVFILANFEHSIANTFYLSMSYKIFSLYGIMFLILNILGNAIGSILFAYLVKEN